MNLANHMLITTVPTVSVNQTGMKRLGRFVPVLVTLVAPLEKSEGANVRRAKPSMITVMTRRRREDDLLPP
jgi:hypothetical protein